MEYRSSSKLELSIGTIAIQVTADGDVERGSDLCNYVLMAATTISNFEALRLADGAKNGGDLHQEFACNSSSGKISFEIKIAFDFEHQVSNRALNTLVYHEMLPEMWKAVGVFTGTQKSPSPRSHRVVLAQIDSTLDALGLEDRTRQPSGRTSEPRATDGRQTSPARRAAARR